MFYVFTYTTETTNLRYWFFATLSHTFHHRFTPSPSQPTGEEKIEHETWEYTTFQRPYRSKEKVDHLAELAAENVKMNKEYILQEIKKAIQRRNQRNIQH